jgi:hypothetical protein
MEGSVSLVRPSAAMSFVLGLLITVVYPVSDAAVVDMDIDVLGALVVRIEPPAAATLE